MNLFTFYPYKSSRWPQRSSVAIHDSNRKIEFSMPGIDFESFYEKLGVIEIPDNVAFACRNDNGAIGTIDQREGVDGRKLFWTTPIRAKKAIAIEFNDAYFPTESAHWNLFAMKKLNRLAPSTPMIVFRYGEACIRA